MGIPWQSNDKDSPLPLLRAQVQFLVGEQRYRKLLGQKITIVIFKLKKKSECWISKMTTYLLL